MAGFTVENQIFGDYLLLLLFPPSLTHHLVSVNQISANVVEAPVAGLLGLGFPVITNTESTPFWLAVINSTDSSNQLSSPDMSFYLRRNPKGRGSTLALGGLFTLGGTDTSLYSGDIDFLPVQLLKAFPEFSFWLLPVSS
jgi:cathepsin D